MFLNSETRAEKQTEAEANEDEIRKQSEFKARAVHIVGEDWQTIQERQAVRRKQRVQLRKEQVGNLHEHLTIVIEAYSITFQMVYSWRSIVDIDKRTATNKYRPSLSYFDRSYPLHDSTNSAFYTTRLP